MVVVGGDRTTCPLVLGKSFRGMLSRNCQACDWPSQRASGYPVMDQAVCCKTEEAVVKPAWRKSSETKIGAQAFMGPCCLQQSMLPSGPSMRFIQAAFDSLATVSWRVFGRSVKQV